MVVCLIVSQYFWIRRALEESSRLHTTCLIKKKLENCVLESIPPGKISKGTFPSITFWCFLSESEVHHCIAYQSEKRASLGFLLGEQFWLISENWVILKADLRDSFGVFELTFVNHTPCSSRQAYKARDAAWRSPAGQVTVPPPRCSSPRKWHGLCCGPKRTIDSLAETWA